MLGKEEKGGRRQGSKVNMEGRRPAGSEKVDQGEEPTMGRGHEVDRRGRGEEEEDKGGGISSLIMKFHD